MSSYYNDSDQVKQLIADVEGDSKSKTQEALVVLTQNYPQWKELIRIQVKDCQPEIRKLIMKAVASSQFTTVQEYLQTLDLLNNPSALVDLLENSEAKELPVRRLKELTGSDFDDEMEWRNWLESRKTDKAQDSGSDQTVSHLKSFSRYFFA